eukprot:GILI01003216.1.p2 GENE.GILI01003216.1~~GILI01003216.1.p2  ORF type:complete len:290 (+),score=43.98 GILI01003216.1:23-871(+)
MENFGDWTGRLPELSESFSKAEPFEHVVIDNFLTEEFATALALEFPRPGTSKAEGLNWYLYHNPIEKKFLINKIDSERLPETAKLYDILQSDAFVDLVKQITSIPNLENDPHLHGAGLHFHPRGGKLDMHLDYSIHPMSGKERRVNLILYLNKTDSEDGWQPEWGGDLELWNQEFTTCVRKVTPLFNRAALFKTSDISYHGLPAPIKCPEGEGRQSAAIYYVSDPRPEATLRKKAQFRPLPWQPIDERLQALYDIRVTRILTPEDLQTHYPTWEQESGNGFW